MTRSSARPLAGLRPTAAEASLLRFGLGVGGLRQRFLLAGILFALGLAGWAMASGPLAVLGLVVVLVGHAVLWVKSQSTAPGGATPLHEEMWAPVEEDWLERVHSHEERGRQWDTTPWDLSNRVGCVVLLGILVALAVLSLTVGARLGPSGSLRLGVGGAVLLVPLWLNGLRTTWNPSELRKKGDALETALTAARTSGIGDFEPVPMLALREGARGKYPVDARLMLRPAEDDGSGFLGVQVQVALNNVRGTDYPYLYAVVLGRDGFRVPSGVVAAARRASSLELVFERGEDDGVRYLVVRQHADNRGGWHTDAVNVAQIVGTALDIARAAREALAGASTESGEPGSEDAP